MNRAVSIGALAMLLTACTPPQSQDPLVLDLGDVDDYAEWLEAEKNKPNPVPFKADPLIVEAEGSVRAVPDIGVVVATLSADDENESRAVNAVSIALNAVQDSLSGMMVETGFSSLRSSPDYAQDCLNENRAARNRQAQIQRDWWFNKRLDDRGDTETQSRAPLPRIPEQVCGAERIKVSAIMVVRVSPAEEAGTVLRALGEAGAENARLFGYDFSDYSNLYQQASENAVTRARRKAQAVANGAGGELGELVSFEITPPGRVGRFGPQPTIIRPDRPSSGDDISALEAHFERVEEEAYREYRSRSAPPPPPPPAPIQNWDGSESDEVIVTGSRLKRDDFSNSTPLQIMDSRLSRDLGLVDSDDLLGGSAGAVTTNALTMSLMSGPQTIRATATLSYQYSTLLDGKIIEQTEEES